MNRQELLRTKQCIKSKMFKFAVIVFLSVVIIGSIHAELEYNSFFGADDLKTCSGELDCDTNGNAERSEQVSEDGSTVREINIIITFMNAVRNDKLKEQFALTVSSLMQHASVPLVIHIIGDEESQRLAQLLLSKNAKQAKFRVVNLAIDTLAHKLVDIVKPMQDRFSYKTGAYYNHALFFLSIAIHRVMPADMKRVIMMDADLKFEDDISKLYDQFNNFLDTNILGIAREMQPVYRHLFWKKRKENPGTRIGDPPPHGLTGFNSGVLLLDLERMRQSDLYNSFLVKDKLDSLAEEYEFKGHLGDQDFFTLLNMKHEELFYVLPCVFNRQLCTWWRDHGYKDVFDLYHDCKGDIVIYHGNCKTPIP